MEKNIILNGQPTDFWLEDTGRLRNARTKRWLKGGTNKGYHFYSLYFKGKQYILYTHRAVAEYFVPNPDNLPIVHHIDGNKLNNFYLNLQWVNAKEHNYLTKEQKVSSPSTRKTKQPIQVEDYNEEDIAQFRNSPYYATRDGQILNMDKKIKLNLEESGNYLRFMGNYNLGHKHFLVHRVIWEAFNGEIPNGYDIDHIDGNPHNNALSNLEKVTHQENIKRRKIDYSYTVNNFNPER